VEASTTAYGQNFEESITLFGEKGTIKIGGKNAIYFEYLEMESMDQDEAQHEIDQIKKDPWGKLGHQCIIEDMIDAVKFDRTPEITGREARKSLELVLAFYESAEKNAPISLIKEKEYASN